MSIEKTSELEPSRIAEYSALQEAWVAELHHHENIDVMEVQYTYSYIADNGRLYELVFLTKLSDSQRNELNYPPLMETIYWRVDEEKRVEVDNPSTMADIANEFSKVLWGIEPYTVMTDEENEHHETQGWTEDENESDD